MNRKYSILTLGLLLIAIALYVGRTDETGEDPLTPSPTPAATNEKAATQKSAPKDRDEAVQSSNDATRWVPGLQIDYALTSKGSVQYGKSEQDMAKASVALSATWRLTVTDVEEERVYVRSEHLEPKYHTTAYPEKLNHLIAKQLQQASYLVFSTRGALLDAYFLPDIVLQTRTLLRHNTLAFQFIDPSSKDVGRAWGGREQDLHGFYQARYEPMKDGRIQKTKRAISHAKEKASSAIKQPKKLNFTASFDTDFGWPKRVEVREELGEELEAGKPLMNSTSVAQLRQVAVRNAPGLIGAFSREKVNLKSYGLFDEEARQASLEAFRKDASQQRLDGQSVSKVLQNLVKGQTDEEQWKPDPKLFATMTELFEQNPQQVLAEIRDAFDGELSTMTQSFLFSVLSAAGTKEAQALLLEQLAFVATEDVLLQRSGLAYAGFSRPGSMEAIDFLKKFAADPKNNAERNTALLAMGNQLQDLQKQDPDQSQPILNDLVSQFHDSSDPKEQALLLATLGNVGDPVLIPLVKIAMTSTHEDLRSAAAYALRFVDDSQADKLLDSFMLDWSSSQVRNSALSACAHRDFKSVETSILRMMIQDPDKRLRHRAIGLVGNALLEVPENLFFMKLAAKKDADATNRKAAAAYVETIESKKQSSPTPNNSATP